MAKLLKKYLEKIIFEELKLLSEDEFSDMMAKARKKVPEPEKDDKEPEKKPEKKQKIEKGDAFAYTSKPGKKGTVQVVDPDGANNSTIFRAINPETCKPTRGKATAATKSSEFVKKIGDKIDKCSTGGEGGEEEKAEIKKGAVFAYKNKAGAIKILEPKDPKTGKMTGQWIGPDKCDVRKIVDPNVDPKKLGDPIEKCNEEEKEGEEKKEGDIAKKLEKLGLKALKKGQATMALNQLRNKGIDAKKFNTAIVKAIKDIHKQAGPQRKNFAQKDAPLIKKIGNEVVKILKGDFSNLVKESRGDCYLVQPETYAVIKSLAEEKKTIKLFIKRKTNNG